MLWILFSYFVLEKKYWIKTNASEEDGKNSDPGQIMCH